MKKIVSTVMLFALSVSLVGGGMQKPAKAASSNKPSVKKKVEVKEGKTKTLNVKGKYIRSCRFRSGKKKIATVTRKGKVTGKKAGTCKIRITVKYKKKKNAKKIFTKILTCTVKVISGAPVPSEEPEEPEEPEELEDPAAPSVPDDFARQYADFSIKLVQNSMREALDQGQNALLSPESVITALALVLDGTAGNTQEELRKNLCGDMDVETFRSRMSEYNNYLTDSRKVQFHLANSIWIRDDERLAVQENYLKRMKDFYNAGVYRSAFDSKTVEEINNWVSEQTDRMIPSILDRIPEEAMLYLINALCFEGRWSRQYEDVQVSPGQTFTNAKGNKETVTMLESKEHQYVEDGKAVGVIKNYEGNKYAFMGILPKDGVTVKEYLDGMTGEDFLKLYQGNSYHDVLTKIPEFSYDYSTVLKDSLQALGIQTVFDSRNADLTPMAVRADEPLFVSNVLHKTHIELDRYGTKAAAVTAVIVEAASAVPEDKPKEVYLDRPFVYAIVDTSSGLPVFIGVVNSAGK